MSKKSRFFVMLLLSTGFVSARKFSVETLDPEILALPLVLTLLLAYAKGSSSKDDRMLKDDMRVSKPDLARSDDQDIAEDKFTCKVCNSEFETEEDKILHEEALH